MIESKNETVGDGRGKNISSVTSTSLVSSRRDKHLPVFHFYHRHVCQALAQTGLHISM